MDIYGALSVLQSVYQKLASYQNVYPGFGMITERYETKNRSSLILIILGPPKSRGKAKEKEFEKLVQKSQASNKFISPKDFVSILPYFASIFGSIVHPRNEILSQLKLLIGSLRIGFVPYQNMKMSFLNPKNPQILVFTEEIDQQFIFFVNILDLKEDGLYLAHEKQLAFLSEMIDKNQNISKITSLPPLRTGETEIEGYGDSEDMKSQEQKEAVARFRDRMQQKKLQSEKEQELEYQTVVNFPKSSPASEDTQGNQSEYPSNSINTPDHSELGTEYVEKNLTPSSSYVPLPPESSLPKPPPMPLASQLSIHSRPIDQKDEQHVQLIEDLEVLKAKCQNYDELLHENDYLKSQLETIVDSLTKQLQTKDLEIKSLTDNLDELQKQYNTLLQEKTNLQSQINEIQSIDRQPDENPNNSNLMSSPGQLNLAMKEALKKQQENLQKMQEKD